MTNFEINWKSICQVHKPSTIVMNKNGGIYCLECEVEQARADERKKCEEDIGFCRQHEKRYVIEEGTCWVCSDEVARADERKKCEEEYKNEIEFCKQSVKDIAELLAKEKAEKESIALKLRFARADQKRIDFAAVKKIIEKHLVLTCEHKETEGTWEDTRCKDCGSLDMYTPYLLSEIDKEEENA